MDGKESFFYYGGHRPSFNSIFARCEATDLFMLPSTEENEITAADLQPILEEVRLIDCREDDEFAHCRIEGADLVPLSRFAELSLSILSPDDERPVVVYCHHGMRSMNATQYLRQRGLEKVWSLAGGIDHWSITIDPDVPRY